MMMRILFLLLFIAVSAGSAALAANDREALEKKIQEMTKDLSCDHSTQCKSLGYGAKPCGGYMRFKIYSTKKVNEKVLLAAGGEYFKLDKAYRKNTGSDCAVAMPLTAACIRGLCQALGDEANAITPIHYAVEQNDIALIKDLLRSGHPVDALSAMRDTPLIFGVQIKGVNPETIKFLLDNGANVNFKYDDKSNTALIHAVTQKRPEVARILMEHGADPSLANHWGNAIDYAKNMNDGEMIQILSRSGALSGDR